MLIGYVPKKLYTGHYKHFDTFEFKGEKYRTYSVVKLSREAQLLLDSYDEEVILLEHFFNHHNGKYMWKYKYHSLRSPWVIIDGSTTFSPDELITEVVMPATEGFQEREILGINAPSYEQGKKHVPKDWEIPGLMTGWAIYLLFFFAVEIFSDLIFKLFLRIVAYIIFTLYRNVLKQAYTTYTHDEDKELLKKKYEVLYGVKFDNEKENDGNE